LLHAATTTKRQPIGARDHTLLAMPKPQVMFLSSREVIPALFFFCTRTRWPLAHREERNAMEWRSRRVSN
jgi:hypothetical protein